MKKIRILAAVATMALALSACGQKADEAANAPADEATAASADGEDANAADANAAAGNAADAENAVNAQKGAANANEGNEVDDDGKGVKPK